MRNKKKMIIMNKKKRYNKRKYIYRNKNLKTEEKIKAK